MSDGPGLNPPGQYGYNPSPDHIGRVLDELARQREQRERRRAEQRPVRQVRATARFITGGTVTFAVIEPPAGPLALQRAIEWIGTAQRTADRWGWGVRCTLTAMTSERSTDRG